MPSFNLFVGMGHLTRDPQHKTTQAGVEICESGLACNHKFKDKDEVLFLDFVVFGKGAGVVNQYCRKGDLLHVTGRLKLDTWESKDGGGKRSKISLIVDQFQLMGNKRNDDQGDDRQAAPARQGGYAKPPARQTVPAEPQNGDDPFPDDSIPF